MPKPILYYIDYDPSSRSVALTVKALNLTVKYKSVDTSKSKRPKYKKLNPQHTIPTLDDNGIVVWDSHAIITYLAEKYDKTDSFYPKDIKTRGTINQRLFYDSSVISEKWQEIVRPIYNGTAKVFPQEAMQATEEVYDLLEVFVMDGYMVGDKLTVADFAIIASLSSMVRVIPACSTRHAKLFDWMRHMFQLPFYIECNGKFVDIMHRKLIKKLQENNEN